MIPPLDPQCHLQAIKAALDLFGKPGQLREIRALPKPDGGAKSFFSTDTLEAAKWVFRRENQPALWKGQYFMLNPFTKGDGPATKNDDVTRRLWVPVDVDPEKSDPSGSATDAEKAAAQAVADKVMEGLKKVFRGVVHSDSGNGYHACIPVDMPNDEISTAAIKALFQRLESQYGNPAAAKIDQVIYNASRILKLPYTTARKGDHSAMRPHRMAVIIQQPEAITDEDRQHNSTQMLKILKEGGIKQKAPGAIAFAQYDANFYPQSVEEDPDPEGLFSSREMTQEELESSLADSLARDAEEQQNNSYDIAHITISERRRRAEPYINAMPISVDGVGGSPKHYSTAMIAVEGFALPGPDAILAMESWNARCKDPWSDTQMQHTITSALRDAGKTNKIGYLLVQEKTAPASITAPAPLLPVADGWPQPIAEAAFIGPIGAFVRRATANSEADRSACLVAALIRFGSRIGRTAVLKVGGTQHHANEFGLLVGPTGSGRKGTTLAYAAHLFGQTDSQKPDWNDPLVGRDSTGLSSGQGVIHALRDPAGDDAGVLEKRLLVSESEFAKVLAGCRGKESTLSAVIRDLWDTGHAGIMNKNTPVSATNAHLSILAGITPDELTTTATSGDVQNGFLNRFLIICCRRPGLAPLPPEVNPSQFIQERGQLRRALESRINLGDPAIHFDQEAQGFWLTQAYAKLESIRHGAAESLLARAAGHVLRLAIIYAVSEGSSVITKKHLQAAMLVFDYAENSVKYLFGDSTGDKKADWILDEIRATPEGLTRSDIYALTGRHLSATDLNKIKSRLEQAGLIRVTVEKDTGGRPTERWFSSETAK